MGGNYLNHRRVLREERRLTEHWPCERKGPTVWTERLPSRRVWLEGVGACICPRLVSWPSGRGWTWTQDSDSPSAEHMNSARRFPCTLDAVNILKLVRTPTPWALPSTCCGLLLPESLYKKQTEHKVKRSNPKSTNWTKIFLDEEMKKCL